MVYYKSGDMVKAKVTAIKHYGAFIETKDGTQGLIHISEIANNFIVDINYYLRVGEIIEVKVLSVKDGKINASINFKNKSHDIMRKNNDILAKQNISYLKYGFNTLEKNLPTWINKSKKEMLANRK